MPVCGLRVALHTDASVWSPMCVVSQLVFSVWSHGFQCVVSQLVFSGCGLTVGLHSDASVWSHSWSSVCVVSQLVFSVCGLSWSSVCMVSQLVFSVCVGWSSVYVWSLSWSSQLCQYVVYMVLL